MTSVVLQYIPYLVLSLSIVAFIVTADVFVKKAKNTQANPGTCSDCWYQQQIGIATIMIAMIFIAFVLMFAYFKVQHHRKLNDMLMYRLSNHVSH